MIAVVLDSQESLSIDKYRHSLMTILGKEILGESRNQLIALKTTHAYLFKDVMCQKIDKNGIENSDSVPLEGKFDLFVLRHS